MFGNPESAAPRSAWVWRLAVVILVLCAVPLAHAEGPYQVEVGWQGQCLVGRWTELKVTLHNPHPARYELRITAPDPDGNPVTFTSTSSATEGTTVLRGLFKVGALSSPVSATVVPQDSALSRLELPVAVEVLKSDVRLVLTVGNPPGFSGGDETASANPNPFQTISLDRLALPVSAQAYDSAVMVVLAGPTVISAEQSGALRDWVAAGGRLLVSLPRGAAAETMAQLGDWLPVSVLPQPITVSELGKLEFFTGRNARIPVPGRMAIPGLKMSQGEILAGSRDEALLVRAPYGLGSVTVLSLDLTQPPLRDWKALPTLCQRLVESAVDTGALPGARNQQLSTSGITDLATQLHGIQDAFGGVQRATPGLVLGLILVFLLIVGPLDYVLCHRVLKRPQATWITLPFWVAAGTLFSIFVASWQNGSQHRVNQLNLVNYDVGTSTLHQRLLTNLYSPSTGRSAVTVIPSLAAEVPRQSSWSGIAESVYGGMLRPAGVRLGAADYEVDEKGLVGLPLLQWSSKALVTETHGRVEGLVESDLQSNGVGQLSGTLLHRFPGPLEDWLLAYGNRVYRHKTTRDAATSLPLPARQLFRLDQPNLFPRELRAFLTGRTVVASGRSDESANQFQNYDVTGQDPATAVRILTFHDVAGGVKYTGLTNRLLDHEDLSHLLKLGRAVLFGRLESPVTRVELNGAAAETVREITYVRIILPVRNVAGDVWRPLERFE